MPAIRVTQALAANQTVTNVLTGSAFEFAGQAEEVEIAITATTADVVADVQFGPDVQVESAPVPTEVAAGRGPVIPDNILISGIAAPGDRLKVQLRETNGVAASATVQVFTKPMM